MHHELSVLISRGAYMRGDRMSVRVCHDQISWWFVFMCLCTIYLLTEIWGFSISVRVLKPPDYKPFIY